MVTLMSFHCICVENYIYYLFIYNIYLLYQCDVLEINKNR